MTKRTITRTAGALAALLAGGAALAACSSSPSSSAPATHTGSETVSGSTTKIAGGAPVIPITARGVSDDHGSFALNAGSSGHGKLNLAGGTVNVSHTKGTQSKPVFDKAACAFRQVNTGTYRIQSGTGRYKDATGSGRYAITFEVRLLKHGKCDPALANGNSLTPTTGSAVFHVTGTWTIRH
jgi:hypothetical protein